MESVEIGKNAQVHLGAPKQQKKAPKIGTSGPGKVKYGLRYPLKQLNWINLPQNGTGSLRKEQIRIGILLKGQIHIELARKEQNSSCKPWIEQNSPQNDTGSLQKEKNHLKIDSWVLRRVKFVWKLH